MSAKKLFEYADVLNISEDCKAYVYKNFNSIYHIKVTTIDGTELPADKDTSVAVGLYVTDEVDTIDINLGANCLLMLRDVPIINIHVLITVLLAEAPLIHTNAKELVKDSFYEHAKSLEEIAEYWTEYFAATGKECKEAIYIEHEGMAISNPWLNENGMELVTPADHYGNDKFSQWVGTVMLWYFDNYPKGRLAVNKDGTNK